MQSWEKSLDDFAIFNLHFALCPGSSPVSGGMAVDECASV
jgi:hypothetical protein